MKMAKKQAANIKDFNLYKNFMQLGDGFIVFDRDYNVIFMNKQMINLYGNGVGQKCYKLICNRSEPCPDECSVRAILRQEGSIKHVKMYKYAKEDQKNRWFEFTSTLAALDDENLPNEMISSIMVMARDITQCIGFQSELEQKNKVLEQKNAQLNSFVYTVSHDLKAPVFSMKGLIQALMEDYKEDLPVGAMEYIYDIKFSADHMGLLILDLLELARIGHTINERENVRVSEILDAVLKKLEVQQRGRNIELVIDKKLPTIFCDRKLIDLVYTNLIDNAIKFTAKNPHPRLKIHFSSDKRYDICSVSDNGIGIDEKYLKKIFEIFQTLDEIKSINSTGVGLTIVKKVIEVHGGKIWVESEKGEGTTFHFSIPKRNWVQFKKSGGFFSFLRCI